MKCSNEDDGYCWWPQGESCQNITEDQCTSESSNFIWCGPSAPTPPPTPLPPPTPAYNYLTPMDIIQTSNLHDIKPPKECEKWGVGHSTYGTDVPGSIVSQLDIARAWVDAGNTKESAHYGLMIVAGEASGFIPNDPGGFGTYRNVIVNEINSGIIQCDTCRTAPNNFDNNNICENIWASTRTALIPALNPNPKNNQQLNSGCLWMNEVDVDSENFNEDDQNLFCRTIKDDVSGDDKKICWDLNSNICTTQGNHAGCGVTDYFTDTDQNFIGPYCHFTPQTSGTTKPGAGTGTGVGWSDIDNFPNQYLRNYLSGTVKGNYSNEGDCIDWKPDGKYELPSEYNMLDKHRCRDPSTGFIPSSPTKAASQSTCCTAKVTKPPVENIAKEVVKCALDNPNISNLLECPTSLGFKYNVNIGFGTSTTCEDCFNLVNSKSLPPTNIISGGTWSWNSTNKTCYNNDIGGDIKAIINCPGGTPTPSPSPTPPTPSHSVCCNLK